MLNVYRLQSLHPVGDAVGVDSDYVSPDMKSSDGSQLGALAQLYR